MPVSTRRLVSDYRVAPETVKKCLSPKQRRLIEMRSEMVNSKHRTLKSIAEEENLTVGRVTSIMQEASLKLDIAWEIYNRSVEPMEKIIESQAQGLKAIEDYLDLPKFKGSVENQQVNPDDIRLRINEAKHNTLMVESGDYSSLED